MTGPDKTAAKTDAHQEAKPKAEDAKNEKKEDSKNAIPSETGKGELPSVDEWIKTQPFATSADIEIPKRLVDQVIGQDDAVSVVKKAAEQKRHVMLIGEPGTGKSMLAQAMAELLPREEMQDIIAYHNAEDPNQPKIRVVPAGKGKEIVNAQKMEAMRRKEQKSTIILMVAFLIISVSFIFALHYNERAGRYELDVPLVLLGLVAAAILFIAVKWSGQKHESLLVPKLLVTHQPDAKAPFIDGTGAHAGALLGDVKHDPFQSGGLETPAHERVEVGAIHKANKGVLFIDEINTLRIESQQNLLTAMQEKQFSIMGQSERSSGAMVKSEPVPTDFILVAAGNVDAIESMHPALRSRIRGYGYEIYVRSTMDDTHENRQKLIRFVAQEIFKDKKIPHFDRAAISEIIREAQRRSGTRGQLTLRLRELGGLVRTAGDIAKEKKSPITTVDHVIEAKKIAMSLEQQIAMQATQKRKDYKTFLTEGTEIGMVNGLAVLNTNSTMAEFAGLVLPIVAEVTPAQSRNEGKIIATGKLGEIAKEAVQNVSALIKKHTGKDISNLDIHIQFVGTAGSGVEGDSASISVATAVISALEEIEVDQSVAMTGSLSVRGQVLPVGGVTAKIEAAAESGIKKVIIPRTNAKDVLIEERYRNRIQIVPVLTLDEVLEHALVGTKKATLVAKLTAALTKPKRMSIARPVITPAIA